MSHPPRTGPITAVIAVKPDQVPMARPRSLSSNDAPMIDKTSGNEESSAESLHRARGDQLVNARCRAAPRRCPREYAHSE